MGFGAVLRLLATACAGMGLAACSVGDLDLAGKSCPCPESSGLTCNEATQTCVDLAGCTPGFVVSDFGHVWATPNQVRWEWEPPPTGEDFGRYTIELGRSAEDIEAGNPEQRLGEATLPELGYYALPNTNEKNEVVRGSVTHGLAAGTVWYARLVADDRSGCPYRTPIAPATTSPEPVAEVLIFDDAPPAGVLFSRPGTFAFQDDCDGEPCMAATWGVPPDGEADHTNNLRVRPYISGSDLEAVISEGQFENPAFLEMRVWLEAPRSSYWMSIWLLTPGALFRFEPYSPIHTPPEPAQSSYRTVQVPLGVLISDITEKPMTRTDLTSTPDGGVEEVNFGARLPPGTRGWIDDIRLRW